MKVKKAVKCKGCGLLTHNLHGTDYDYCKRCFNSGKDVTMINIGEIFYEDILNVGFTCSFNLTKKQEALLIKRLKMLFPDKKGRKKSSHKGISTYLRLLVLTDLKNTYGEEYSSNSGGTNGK